MGFTKKVARSDLIKWRTKHPFSIAKYEGSIDLCNKCGEGSPEFFIIDVHFHDLNISILVDFLCPNCI